MFKMKKRRTNNYQDIESIISSGVELKGELSSKGSTRIDGYMEGKININGDLVLGETGFAKGELKADNMLIAGKVEGDVIVSNRLEITGTGSILGNASCLMLVIEEGGILDGVSKMGKPKNKAEVSNITDIKKNQA